MILLRVGGVSTTGSSVPVVRCAACAPYRESRASVISAFLVMRSPTFLCYMLLIPLDSLTKPILKDRPSFESLTFQPEFLGRIHYSMLPWPEAATRIDKSRCSAIRSKAAIEFTNFSTSSITAFGQNQSFSYAV